MPSQRDDNRKSGLIDLGGFIGSEFSLEVWEKKNIKDLIFQSWEWQSIHNAFGNWELNMPLICRNYLYTPLVQYGNSRSKSTIFENSGSYNIFFICIHP